MSKAEGKDFRQGCNMHECTVNSPEAGSGRRVHTLWQSFHGIGPDWVSFFQHTRAQILSLFRGCPLRIEGNFNVRRSAPSSASSFRAKSWKFRFSLQLCMV